jgi:hypothetical protein
VEADEYIPAMKTPPAGTVTDGSVPVVPVVVLTVWVADGVAEVVPSRTV